MGDGIVKDYWSVRKGPPPEDDRDDLEDTEVKIEDGKYYFTTYRKRNTGDD